MTQELPPRFTSGFGRNHSSQTGSGSHEVQMLRNKIVLAVFFIPPHYQSYPKNGTKLDGEIAFFSHWMSVLHYHCGAFPGAGKGWISLGWKSFRSDREVMRKTIIALGSGLSAVWVCPLAPAETGWDPVCRASNLTQLVARETDRQTVLGSVPQPFDSYVMKIHHLFFFKIKFTCYKYCICQGYSLEKACIKGLL